MFLASLVFFFSVSRLFAFRTYGTDSPQVVELQRLYTLDGRAFPISGFPLSGEDLRKLTVTISRDSDDPALREKARQILNSLELPKEGEAIYGQGFDAGFEANVHDSYAWDPYRAFYNEFVDYPAMLDYSLFAEQKSSSGYSGMEISAFVQREYEDGNMPEVNLISGTSDDPIKMENYFISSGYFAWEGDHLSLRLGRSPVHYGDSRFSSFLPSDRLPFLDAFEYRYKVGPLRMVSYFGTLENRESEEEAAFFAGKGLEIDGTDDYLTVDEDGNLVWDYADQGTADEVLDAAFARTIILNSMHRFVLELPKFSFGVTAHLLIARENNALHIADIFPVFSWHNGSVGSNNMSLLFDGLWNVTPGLDLYAQAGWDDINATDLIGIPDKGSIPTIGAYLLGADWEGNLNLSEKTLPIGLITEVGTTHYLWGNFYAWSEKRKDGIYFARAIYRYRTQSGVHAIPLTSPYGPGATWIEGTLKVGGKQGLSSELFFSYLDHNELASLISTNYYSSDEIEDADHVQSIASALTFRYGFPVGKRWESSLYTSLCYYNYDGFSWPELVFGCRIRGSLISSFMDTFEGE